MYIYGIYIYMGYHGMIWVKQHGFCFFSPQHPSSQLLSAGDQPGTGEVLDRMDNGQLGKSMGKVHGENHKNQWENPL